MSFTAESQRAAPEEFTYKHFHITAVAATSKRRYKRSKALKKALPMRTRVARCQRLDVNAKQFVPLRAIRAYCNSPQVDGTLHDRYMASLDKYIQLIKDCRTKDLHALIEHLYE